MLEAAWGVTALAREQVPVPRIALAGAAAVAFGMALAQAVQVERPSLGAGDDAPEEPSIVDLAIEEAEALDEDPSARRFRGVDPTD